MNIFKTKQKEQKTELSILPYKVLEEGQAPLFKTTKELETFSDTLPISLGNFTVNSIGYELLEHRERLFKAQNKYNDWFTDNEVKTLQKAGFKWFALKPFVKQFKYHASLDNIYTIVHQHSDNFISSCNVLYAGDIPIFALDKIELARNIKFPNNHNIYHNGIEYFSIHSMQPMPVELVLTDPVIIGWKSLTTIWLNPQGIPQIDKDAIGEMGVIITAWDKEGELR